MASLGHVAVGLLAGRVLLSQTQGVLGASAGRATTWRTAAAMVGFSGLALLPDVDYLGVMMGVPNSGPCGHRGATHSLIPVFAAALLGAVFAPRVGMARWPMAILAGLVVASHPLLDAMTVTSRGVPLLWPYSFARFEMPWRPIPNAPCGLDYISPEGLRVALIEFFQFLPLLILAFRPAKKPAPLAAQLGPRRKVRQRLARRITRQANGT